MSVEVLRFDKAKLYDTDTLGETYLTVEDSENAEFLIFTDFRKVEDYYEGEVWNKVVQSACDQDNGYFGKWVPCEEGYKTETPCDGKIIILSKTLCDRIVATLEEMVREYGQTSSFF